MQESIRVTVVDGEDQVRKGLEVLLEAAEGFVCIDTCRDSRQLLTSLSARKPDVVVMPLAPHGPDNVEAIRRALQNWPELTILVLTVHDDDELIYQALSAGAQGYLVKPLALAKVVEAIHDVYHGGSPMSSSIARKVVSFCRRQPGVADFVERSSAGRRVALTKREQDVLTNLADGKSYKEIARIFKMSVNTVRYHIRNLYEKLEVHSQSEAVAKGLRQGLI